MSVIVLSQSVHNSVDLRARHCALLATFHDYFDQTIDKIIIRWRQSWHAEHLFNESEYFCSRKLRKLTVIVLTRPTPKSGFIHGLTFPSSEVKIAVLIYGNSTEQISNTRYRILGTLCCLKLSVNHSPMNIFVNICYFGFRCTGTRSTDGHTDSGKQ